MDTDIAQLVSVALYSPKPDESVAFFHDMLGMEISHREGQSVYMRAYEDFYQYTLKITEAKQAGLEEVTWRASSPGGSGSSCRFGSKPQAWAAVGRRMTTLMAAPTNSARPMVIAKKYCGILNTSRRRRILPANFATVPRSDPLRGVPVRRIDHVNLMVSDVVGNTDFRGQHAGIQIA